LIGTPEQPFHDKAAISAQAAEAAGRQDKFWELHGVILARQAEWVNITPEEFQTWVVERAGDLSLDTDKFIADMQDPEIVAKVQEAWEYGNQIQIPGTPFLLVNGNPWPSSVPMDYWSIAAVTKLTLLEKIQLLSASVAIDPQALEATLHTDKDDIIHRLFADKLLSL
jgi:protein-disulfide isomerase